MIDGGVEIDLEAAKQNIREAEIVGLYFPTLRRTLLMDTRRNEYAGTFIRVVPMARNSGDRLRSIRHLRPMFPRPESITLIPWEARVDSMLSTGVWDALVARLDDPEAATSCLKRLQNLERTEFRSAILGHHHYQTLWSRE